MKNIQEHIDLIFSNINNDIQWIKDRTIFLTIHGSHAYGLNTPESDIDYRGICIAPKQYYLGFNQTFNELVREKPNPDTQIFDIIKFFKLTTVGNPNTLELLFVDPEEHILVTKVGQKLIDHKEQFLSKALKERYIGYAKSQAHRIKNHRRWLLSENKMEYRPTRAESNLPDKPAIDKEDFDAIKSAINKKLEEWNPHFEPFSESQKIYVQGKISDILTEMQITSDSSWAAAARTIGLNENLIRIIQLEREYENKVKDWESFCKWKKNRNPKRAALEEKYGYDLKHATQLVRLLRVGKEVLDTCKLQVKRIEDREELLAIKNGAWSFDTFIEYADKIEAELKDSYKNSKLPNQPNIKLLDNLCIQIVEESII